MKCYLRITGQIMGNSRLLRGLEDYYDYTKTRFNGYRVYYNTKRDAKKDVRKLYNKLKEETPRDGRLSVAIDNTILWYDASKIELFTLN